MDGRSLSGYQHKDVWVNDGAGHFDNVAQAVGVTDTHDGRSVAMADLWNRGVLDVVVANQRGPLLIYKNHVSPENKWIEFQFEGTSSNRSAIGAEVILFWNGQKQVQEVSGGSGFCAQNDRRVHFGLGKAENAELVEIARIGEDGERIAREWMLCEDIELRERERSRACEAWVC